LCFIYTLLFQWVTGDLSQGVEWLGHEVDHSLLFRAKVKNDWNCTSASCLNGIDWDTFTLTF
jgi:hypothetical protein